MGFDKTLDLHRRPAADIQDVAIYPSFALAKFGRPLQIDRLRMSMCCGAPEQRQQLRNRVLMIWK